MSPRDAMLSSVLGTPQLTRLEAPEGRPEFDVKRDKFTRYAAAAALLAATVGAAADAPLLTHVFGGLSGGLSSASQQNRRDYMDRLRAYQDRLFDVQRINAGIEADQANLDLQAGKARLDFDQDVRRTEETARHNAAVEAYNRDQLGAETERQRRQDEETGRHNRETERIAGLHASVAQQNAATAVRSEQRLSEGLGTGRPLALGEIDRYMTATAQQIRTIQALPVEERYVYQEQLAALQKQLGGLQQLKIETLAGMKGADVEAMRRPGLTEQPAAGTGQPRPFFVLPGGPLDRMLQNQNPNGPKQGPVPSQQGGAGAQRGRSRYGLEGLL